jgi:hypothetical protein
LGTPLDPDDISIRWHKSYYARYLNGDQQLDRIFDNIVEKELPWTRLTSESVADFRTDLPVGTCTSEHTKEYFESTLPSKPPKIHLCSIWSTYGPYSQKKLSLDENESISNGTRAVSNDSKGVGAPLMQTFDALSQTATTNNSQYLDQSNDFDLFDDTLLDDGEGNKLESHGEEELDTSMLTYSSKSPDHEFEK